MKRFAKIYEYPDDGIQAVVMIRGETRHYKVHIIYGMIGDPIILGWNANTMEDAELCFNALTVDIVYNFLKHVGNPSKSYEVLSEFAESMV